MRPLVLKLKYVFYFSVEEIQNMVATMEVFIPSVPKLVSFVRQQWVML